MRDRDDAHELSPAEAAFVEFLSEQDSGRPIAFESFAARHPEHVDELRRLHEEWLNVARVLRRGREEATPRQDLEELRLAPESEELKLEFAGELVRRLARSRNSDDRYESRGELARGGMGVIYRVWDPRLRRQLAMKVILARRDVASPEERGRAMHRALSRFLEEAQITSQLDHPGIVPVHDLGIDARGRVYFTMRLVRGRDFRSVLQLVHEGAEGWTLARALGVLLKVCEAVAYSHSKSVIHRDLKPANVMVGRFGEVYVMDWGLARVIGRRDAHDLRVSTSAETTSVSRIDTDVRRFEGITPGSPLLTMDGRVVGTPSYMSPEQAKGRVDELGPQTDVYAIGAMLYHLLTGRMPYVPPGAGISPSNVYNMLLSGPPVAVKKIVPDAPDELVAICEKAMARESADRYADPLEIAADIEAFLDRRPIRARPPTIAYATRLFLERNRALATTVGAALVLLLMVVSVAWSNSLAERRQTDRLLDLRSAQALAASIDELFPAAPANLAAMDRWLADVDRVLSKAPEHRAELAAARAARRDDEVAQLAPAVLDMDRLESKLRPEIAGWRERAADLARVSLEVDERKWREAIADVAALPVYRGLALAPQLGLVPLRRDPTSGLWEFWHVLSGERPVVDRARPDRYALTERSGIVLVLDPGGESELGYPPETLVPITSSTLHPARLAPFFIGKYEVTQAQWKRVMDAEPSLYPAGIALASDGVTGEPTLLTTRLHPVESVNFEDCVRFVRRIDLELPTEDQWEHAARGGARGIFWWEPERRGAEEVPLTMRPIDVAGFEHRENVADACAAESMGLGLVGWRDDFPFHAPVGTFAPNPFGLFDVLGNVSEWCSDRHPEEHVTLDRRLVRGGNWFSSEAGLLALSARGWDSALVEQSVRGLRVARALR